MAMTRKQRDELLERLYDAHLKRMVEMLEDGPAESITPALLTSCRQALDANDVNAETLGRLRGKPLEGVEIPAFPDDVPGHAVPFVNPADKPRGQR